MADLGLARDFLSWWFAGAPAGFYGLSWQLPGGPFSSSAHATIEELVTEVGRRHEDGAAGIWFRTTTLRVQPPGRGVAADTLAVPGVWADLDIEGEGHKNERLPADEDAALDILRRARVGDPSALLHTGGGLSAWWKFDTAIVTDTAAALDEAAGLTRGFNEALIRCSPGVRVDNVSDLARVMRVPGTDNRKTGAARRVAVRQWSRQTYAAAELIQAPPASPVRAAATSAPVTLASVVSEAGGVGSAPPLAQAHQGRFAANSHDAGWIADQLDAALRRLANTHHHEGFNEALRDAGLALGHAVGCLGLTAERGWDILDAACVAEFGSMDGADRATASAALRKGMAEPWTVRPPADAPNTAGSDGGTGRYQLPSPNTPMPAARAVAERWAAAGHHLRYWRGDWYRHIGTHWEVEADREVRGRYYLETEPAYYLAWNEKKETWEEKAWNPHSRTVSFALDVMSAAILGRPESLAEDRCIAVVNGVLDPVARVLHPHTPDRFNLWSLPYAYDAAAACPTWLRFLAEQIPDADSRLLLQQYFGYLVSGRTDLEKLLHLYGVRRGGKSTVAAMAEALVGGGNTASVTLSGLTGAFGEQPLIGKSLAMITDANWKIKDATSAAEVVKAIVGNDSRTVNRKNMTSWKGRLGCRWLVVGNDEPEFKDASGALLGRMIHIYFGVSVYGREDTTLKERLLAELPGILNWALDGLASLTASGRLIVPRASLSSEAEIARGTSPVTGFIEDCVTLMDPTCGISSWVDDLWPAYQAWCRVEGKVSVPDKSQFSRAFGTAIGRKAVRQRPGGRDTNPKPIFDGVALLPPAAPGQTGRAPLGGEGLGIPTG